MSFIQLTGLSGAGKSQLAQNLRERLAQQGRWVEVVDGDAYRKTLCSDLGFSRVDRFENIRRLGKLAAAFASEGAIAIIAAINPFEEIRKELTVQYNAATVWIKCDLDILRRRDTKGLYYRAALPEGHPEKLWNLTGVNDIYEEPIEAALVIDTGTESVEVSADKLYRFAMSRFGS